MTRIAYVECTDFKGSHEYELSGRDIVVGPHGSGKSRLREAIQFALSGHVPGAGKRLDDLRVFFGPGGGEVRLTLSDAVWISRGLVVDIERGTISSTLDTSEEDPENRGSFNLAPFRASEVVLNLGELIGQAASIKSPEKKRQWLLDLLGSGEAGEASILEVVADRYVKHLNPMATTQHLAEGVSLLQEDVRAAALCWGNIRGILQSTMKRGASLTQACKAMLSQAKDSRKHALSSKRECQATMKSLEGDLSGAEAAAKDLMRLEAGMKALSEQLAQALEKIHAVATAQGTVRDCERAIAQAKHELRKLRAEPIAELLALVNALAPDTETIVRIRQVVGKLSLAHRRREKALAESLKDSTDLLAEAKGRLENGPDVAQEEAIASRLEESIERQKEQMAAAQKGAGKLEAYQQAKKRHQQWSDSYEAWGYAQRAIAEVREGLVLDAAHPIVGAANNVLAASGRPERAYLELENARGAPTWEFGWIAAGGTRRPLEALSGAETTLLSAALAVAIASFSKGRKVLLIEAAEIHGAVGELLDALSGAPAAIENIVVMTAATGLKYPQGWNVIELGKEVAV